MSHLKMKGQIEALITTCIPLKTSPIELEAMALKLAVWQMKNIPEYGRFAQFSNPSSWADIPAVPTPLFTAIDFCISENPAVTYLTSGTSTGTRGRHFMPTSEVADLAAKIWFNELIPSPPNRCLGLVPNPEHNPESSLGAMVKALFPNTDWAFSTSSGVNIEVVLEAINQREEPLFIASTALALSDTIEAIKNTVGASTHLPLGSIIMITGGFKGRHRDVSEDDLVDATLETFGDQVQIVHEYGMTELSSQLWDLGNGFIAPPWLHVYTVSPATGLPCSGVGLLRFVDLANYGSCIAIETLDLGIVEGRKVTLLGRLPGSKKRGCSLTADELTL